jgi:EpsI family protein
MGRKECAVYGKNPMKKPIIVSFILGMLMVSSGVLTKVMTPSVQIEGQQDKFNLEAMIPREFDRWKIDLSTVTLMVNPDAQGLLNKIYNQTLSRTYINDQGERVMLSIAYGRDQSTDMHVHRPEICYAADGFDIGGMTKSFVDTIIGRIPVMQLVATQGARNEPITYWIRVGDSLTRGWVEQKLTAIGYSLTGKVPDGLLFRVSTISNDENDSYRIQQTFLAALLLAVRSEDRHWLVGRLAP